MPGGGNDPGSITDPAVLANSFLMPRGYTHGVERLGARPRAARRPRRRRRSFPIAKNRDGSTITGPSYEYIVTGGASFALAYPAATLDKTKAKLTHRVHLDDVPQVDSRRRAGTTTPPAPRSAWPGGNFVTNDIYEFTYTAKDPTVNGLGFAAVRDWNAWLRYERRDDAGNANPLAGDIKRIYTEVVVAAGTLAQRLPPPRLQRVRERQEGVRRPDAVDRRGQRHQHELPLLADRAAPSATARTTSTSRACSRSPT